MAVSVNKVIVAGHLGRDPDLRYTTNGTATCRLNVATNERHRDRDGNWQDKTEWHRVVLFKRQAEVAAEYCRKGSFVYVEGKNRTRSYDKDGQTHYITEILGFGDFQFGAGGNGSGSSGQDRQTATANAGQADGGNGSSGGGGGSTEPDPFDWEDDIPFASAFPDGWGI